MDVWTEKKLGEITEVYSGGTPLKSKSEYWNGDIAWYSSGELNHLKTDAPDRFITTKGLENSNAKLFPEGSLLIGMYDTAALKMSIIDRDATFNQAVAGVKPNDGLDLRFVLYAINSQKPSILKLRRGVRQKNLSLSKIKDISIFLPNIKEQERIVAILDEAFAAIATATANAEKNLANARELFESELNTVFESLPSHWEKQELCTITTKIGSGATPRGGSKSYCTEGISLIRSLNVHDREFRMKKLAFINDEQAGKLKNVIVQGIDVLFNITGASIARCCTANDAPLPARVNQHVMIIRPDIQRLDSGFLCYCLTARCNKEILLGIGDEGGATRQAITKSQMQSLVVACPPIIEQRCIFEKLQAFEVESLRLAEFYQRKIDLLAELKQSVLHTAFTGELTADADVADGMLAEAGV